MHVTRMYKGADEISHFEDLEIPRRGTKVGTLSDWFENAYIRVAGSDNYDALFTGELSWEDQTVKDTLGFLGQILTEDFMNGGSSNALQTGNGRCERQLRIQCVRKSSKPACWWMKQLNTYAKIAANGLDDPRSMQSLNGKRLRLAQGSGH